MHRMTEELAGAGDFVEKLTEVHVNLLRPGERQENGLRLIVCHLLALM